MDSVHKQTATDSIQIDTSQIPEHVQFCIAAATLKAVKKFASQPGGREFLEAKKAEIKAAAAAAK